MNRYTRIWPAAGISAAVTGRPDMWPVPTGIFRHADTWLDHPAWVRAGTGLGPGMLPLFIPLADAMCIAQNFLLQRQDSALLDLLTRQAGTPGNPVYAALLDQGRNAGEGLEALGRYISTTHPHIQASCSRQGSKVSFTMTSQAQVPGPVFALFGGILTVSIVRYLQRFGPIRADELAISVPGYTDLLADRLAVRVMKGTDSLCRFDVAASLHARANPGHDPQLWQLALDRLIDLEQAGRRPDLMMRLEVVIGESLSLHARLPTLAQAARSLGMSDRTLSRRLADSGAGLRELADRVRERRARQLITMSTLDIDEIAHQLGYPDRTSFTRHFRAWFGTSPAAFRRTLAS